MAFISIIATFFYILFFIISITASIIGLILLAAYFIKKKKSKVILAFSIITLIIGVPTTLFLSTLSIISGIYYSEPKTIVINDIKYKTGFYDDLYPVNIIRTDEKYIVKRTNVYRVDYERFDFVHYCKGATIGDIGIDGGTVYCNQEQWKEAKAFYKAPENFVIKCRIGGAFKNHKSKT